MLRMHHMGHPGPAMICTSCLLYLMPVTRHSCSSVLSLLFGHISALPSQRFKSSNYCCHTTPREFRRCIGETRPLTNHSVKVPCRAMLMLGYDCHTYSSPHLYAIRYDTIRYLTDPSALLSASEQGGAITCQEGVW